MPDPQRRRRLRSVRGLDGLEASWARTSERPLLSPARGASTISSNSRPRRSSFGCGSARASPHRSGRPRERQREIKDLEHQGDGITHEIVSTLNRTFVTPFDHEDIYALASGLDDILDYIEEVADTANLYRITTIPEPARELTRLLALAVAQLEQAIGKLESGKGIDEHSAEVHRLEDVGDSTSRHAIADLFGDHHPPLEIIKLKDLYRLLEDALDRCETVANVLEGIATKNA